MAKIGKEFPFSEENIKLIYDSALGGMIESQIAGLFRVGSCIFEKWKKKHPEIRAALTDGKSWGINNAIGVLQRLINQGNVAATIFYLKTQALMRETNRFVDINNDNYRIEKPHKINLKGVSSIDSARIYQQVMKGDYVK
jgi:hypothetical protein